MAKIISLQKPEGTSNSSTEEDPIRPKKKSGPRRVLKILLIGFFSLLFILLFAFLMFQTLFAKAGISNFGELVYDFVFTPEEKIESFEGRTNFLLLGKGGDGHDAPDLTDTIIFASISHNKKDTVLISLPRDIWITELRTKLNSIYYWGKTREENGGLVLAKEVVEDIVGQPIHYGIVLDFAGFKELVDVAGGAEVDVERAFVDEKYPIPGKENDPCDGDREFRCRYETISFEEGRQLMDGETALKFVRSRNAEGDEGTDFARAERQQKVLLAVKNKILGAEVLFRPQKIFALLDVVKKSTETDIPPGTGAIIARRILESNKKINPRVFPEEFLVNPPILPRYDNLYVFVPKDGDWRNIHAWVDEILSR